MIIKNVRIYPVVGEVIESGYIIVKGKKISEIGQMADFKAATEDVIDGGGKTIYPGFIDAHTHIGISEEGIGWEGKDYNEMTDPITPNMSVLDGIYPGDTSFIRTMEAGITTTVVSPGSANIIGGKIVAIKTAPKKDVEKMVLKGDVAMKMALGENPKRVYGTDKKSPSTRMASAAVLREALQKAKVYMESGKKDVYDPKSEALIPVLKREMLVHIHAHRSDDILTAVRIAKEFNLDYVLVHCSEGHLIADELKEENARIITGPFLTTQSKFELKNATEANPGVLFKAGLNPAICTDHGVIPQQFLALATGICVKAGLPFEEGIKAITINAAISAGIEDRVGSIEVGKDADFVITGNDPLLTYEKPAYVIIDGIVTHSQTF